MKSILLVALLLLTAPAFAEVENLLGNYTATDFGCAAPKSPNYTYEATLTVDRYEAARDSAMRRYAVTARFKHGNIACTVWYEGPISYVVGEGFYGSLARTTDNGGRGYNCGQLNDRDAGGAIKRYVDPLFVETDVITPLNIVPVGTGFSIQQAVALPGPIQDCSEYPVYTFQ